jgi:hypothetical protein
MGEGVFSVKGPPHLSLPVADVVAALSAVESYAGPVDKRVMGVRVEDHDTMLVRTGEVPAALTGGGYLFRVQRTCGGWRVTQAEQWVN